MKKREGVELQCLHQTRHAAEGGQTRNASGIDAPQERARRQLMRELSALLRQEDGKLRWLAPVQAGISALSQGVSPGQLLLETRRTLLS